MTRWTLPFGCKNQGRKCHSSEILQHLPFDGEIAVKNLLCTGKRRQRKQMFHLLCHCLKTIITWFQRPSLTIQVLLGCHCCICFSCLFLTLKHGMKTLGRHQRKGKRILIENNSKNFVQKSVTQSSYIWISQPAIIKPEGQGRPFPASDSRPFPAILASRRFRTTNLFYLI